MVIKQTISSSKPCASGSTPWPKLEMYLVLIKQFVLLLCVSVCVHVHVCVPVHLCLCVPVPLCVSMCVWSKCPCVSQYVCIRMCP